MQSNSIESDLSFQEYVNQIGIIDTQEKNSEIYNNELTSLDVDDCLPKVISKFLKSTKNDNLSHSEYVSQLTELILYASHHLSLQQLSNIYKIASLRIAVINNDTNNTDNVEVGNQYCLNWHSFSNIPLTLQEGQQKDTECNDSCKKEIIDAMNEMKQTILNEVLLHFEANSKIRGSEGYRKANKFQRMDWDNEATLLLSLKLKSIISCGYIKTLMASTHNNLDLANKVMSGLLENVDDFKKVKVQFSKKMAQLMLQFDWIRANRKKRDFKFSVSWNDLKAELGIGNEKDESEPNKKPEPNKKEETETQPQNATKSKPKQQNQTKSEL
jgi:hypothetical protein